MDSLADVKAEITQPIQSMFAAGTPTIIRWSVSPEDADITIVADTDEEIAGTDQCDGDVASISAAGVVGSFSCSWLRSCSAYGIYRVHRSTQPVRMVAKPKIRLRSELRALM